MRDCYGRSGLCWSDGSVMYPFIDICSKRVPTYGVLMMLGLLAGGFVALWRTNKRGFRWENALTIGACAFATALFGAAVMYIAVTYSLREIVEMARTGELWKSGVGLVFYGGLIGTVPGIWIGKKITRVRIRDYVAPMLPSLPLGHAFGRIGCLLAGCCYGRPTTWAIGVKYSRAETGVPKDIALLPVQAFESLCLILIFVGLVCYTRKKRPARRIVALYMLAYAPCRFFLEFLRYDTIRGLWHGLSTSQWISAGLFIIGIGLWGKQSAKRV